MISHDRAISRQEILHGLSLFLLTVVSRIPFRSQILYHWDSVNLAFGMREFNVAAEQPQPPGYIVYVWLCRVVDVLFNDAQVTMVWIAIVSSGLAVVATCLLGRAMFGAPTGVVAGLFLASSPLFWFYGEIALPHCLDAFLVTLSAWGLYQTMRGRSGFLYPTVAVLALLGGVRQQSLIFLLPLILFTLRGVGWRRFLAAGSLGVALCLLWAVPLFNSCGGLARYLEVFSNYSSLYTAETSILSAAGWRGVGRNVSKLVRYLLYSWGVALIPPTLYVLIRLLRGRDWERRWEDVIFLGLWCAPTILLYTFVHMGQQGLIFTFFPALIAVSAAALVRLLETRSARLRTSMTVLLVAVNASFFLFLPQYPLGANYFKVLSWDTLRENDAYYEGRFRAIREHFPAESTVVVATRWRHVQYYLSEYEWLPFPHQVGRYSAEELDLEDPVDVVLFDSRVEDFGGAPDGLRALPLGDDGEMAYLRLESGEVLELRSEWLGIDP